MKVKKTVYEKPVNASVQLLAQCTLLSGSSAQVQSRSNEAQSTNIWISTWGDGDDELIFPW